ncbi:methyltransferase domain-containing protein [Ferrovibrio sp.]|uniref:class I SAM-dependent DNA methyltransferase n=1 Tax=Ferrovibrio sp. TaxID=1917215 RepID=UPI0025C5A6C5|nr:methyltransferase domain-containing protein [Ferrovibrio sp.]
MNSNTQSAQDLLQLAWQAQSTGQLDRAAEIYRKALDLEETAPSWLGLGQCHLERKDPSAALAAFRRAQALMPQSGAIRHMVDMLEGSRVPDRAPDDYVVWVFDGHAESFEAHLAALNYRGPQMVAGLAEGIWAKDGSRAILDLGCGTGLNAPIFRPYAQRLDGVDLAPRMLQQASRRGGYDHLYKAEAHAFLRRPPCRYDVVLATDVFIYIGQLDEIFSLSEQYLNKNGELLFTVELTAGAQPVELRSSGRFRQTDTYIRMLAERTGFAVAATHDEALRVENGVPEAGRAYRLVRR